MSSSDHAEHDEFVAGCPFCEGERDCPLVDLDDVDAIAGMGVAFSEESE